jgi:hypothetical protein
VRTDAITKIAEIARANAVLRTRDLQAHGIARQYLRVAEQQGLIVRSPRGLYVPTDADATEFYTFGGSENGVLRFHNIGTQNPFEV